MSFQHLVTLDGDTWCGEGLPPTGEEVAICPPLPVCSRCHRLAMHFRADEVARTENKVLVIEVKLKDAERRAAKADKTIKALVAEAARLRDEWGKSLDTISAMREGFNGILAVHRPVRSNTRGTDYCGGCGPDITPWPCELARSALAATKALA